jgi:hypothetical protein
MEHAETVVRPTLRATIGSRAGAWLCQAAERVS